MESQDNTGDGDGDILGEDGGLDHDVPGPRVHQPAQSVAEDEECEAADQAVHRHQLETVATTEGVKTPAAFTAASAAVYLPSNCSMKSPPINCHVLSPQAARALER